MGEPPPGSTRDTEGEIGSTSKPRQLLESLHQRRERFQQRNALYRWIMVVVGVLVTLVGLAMLVLPGPALLVIPVGLAILALQFAWAERLLERAVDQAERAADAASGTSRTQRIALGVAGAAVGGAALAWAYVGDVPLLPV